jgi:hypothetical protein
VSKICEPPAFACLVTPLGRPNIDFLCELTADRTATLALGEPGADDFGDADESGLGKRLAQVFWVCA